MATKSAEKRALERSLLQMGPAQMSLLPGSPETVEYTGLPGRPKGRKNNKTLFTEAGLEQMGERLLRERFRMGLLDPVAEAKKIVAQIYNLDATADPSTVLRHETDKDGNIIHIVSFADEVREVALAFANLKEKAANNALPFVRKKMPQEVDWTLQVPEARFVGFDDAIKAVAGDGAKNVTPAVIDHEEK